jgi:hypothetical protein
MSPDDTDLRPVVVSTDTPERVAAWRALEGRSPDALACIDGPTRAHLVCLRVWEGPRRRWVLASDVASWGRSGADLLRGASAGAPAAVARAELVPIDGTPDRYLRLLDPDGWAAAGLLRPDLLVARLGGGPVRVAIPAEGVLLAWPARQPAAASELDRVMAVGVREWFDRGTAPVSPLVLTWDGATWSTFGEAVPKQ